MENTPQYWWFQGMATNGKRVEYLSQKEYQELVKKEQELEQQQQSDARLAPVMNKAVSDYAKETGTASQITPYQESIPRSMRNQDPISSKFDEIQTSNEDTTGLEKVLSDASAQRSVEPSLNVVSAPSKPSTIQGLPDDQYGDKQQPTGTLQRLMADLPPEIIQPLLIQYNTGDLKPSQLLAEIKKAKKELYDIRKGEEKAKLESGLKISEKAPELSSLEKRTGMEQEGANKRQIIAGEYGLKEAGIRAENSSENARQQQAALRAAEFSEKEKDMIGAVEEGKIFMQNLVETFNSSGFGGAGSISGQIAAKTPGVGKFIAKKNKEYQNQKRVVAETWLRAATGAAAPAQEVQTYTGFLPDESDQPDIAQKKLENFFNKISAKAEGRSKAIELEGTGLEKRGMVELANVKYIQANTIRSMITTAKDAIPKIKGSMAERQTSQPAGKTTITPMNTNDFDSFWNEVNK